MKINKTYIAPAIRVKTIKLQPLLDIMSGGGNDNGDATTEAKGLSLFDDDDAGLFN